MSSFTSVPPVFAGLAGTPNSSQLNTVLEHLDVHDSVVVVSPKVVSKRLRNLILSYGFGLVVRNDMHSDIHSLFVFDDANVEDLLAADMLDIPIYKSSALAA